MACVARDRERVRAALDAAACDGRVIATDLLEPSVGPTDLWTAELTLEPEAGGVPPALQRELAHRDLVVRDVSPQGLFWLVVVAP